MPIVADKLESVIPHWWGAKGDGTIDDRGALASAAAAAGPTGTLRLPPGTYRVASNVTLFSAIIFDQGAILSPDTGVVVTLSNTVQAGPYQIMTTGTGTIVFTNVARLFPEWWGAKGNGSTDDTAAIQAAIVSAESRGGAEICFTRPTYLVTTTILLAGQKPMALVAHGNAVYITGNIAGAAIINFDPGLSLGNSINGFVVRNLGVVNTSATGIGVRIRNLGPPALLQNLNITAYQCVVCPDSIFELLIDSCHITGPGGSPVGSVGVAAQGVNIISCSITGFDHGVRLSGSNGCSVIGCRFEVNRIAFKLGRNPGDTGSDELNPALISDCALEANDTGFDLTSGNNAVTVSGIFMRATVGSPSAGAIRGIYVSSSDVAFMNCESSGTFSIAGVEVTAASPGRLSFISCKFPSWVFGTTQGIDIENCNIGRVANSFTNGDTTPSVFATTNGGNPLFKTNNASPTTITNFDDGLSGYELILKAGDANTTLTHGTNLFLKSGANKTLANAETIRFTMYDDNKWYEI